MNIMMEECRHGTENLHPDLLERRQSERNTGLGMNFLNLKDLTQQHTSFTNATPPSLSNTSATPW